MSGLNDRLDDLFAGAGTAAQIAEVRPLSEKATAHQEANPAGYFDKCRKCSGTGRYYGRSSYGSSCFACNGKGGRHYKTSPEVRAAHRASAAERKAKRDAEIAAEASKAAAAWRLANPEIALWLSLNSSDFAASLSTALYKFGSLTERQAEAVRNAIARDAARADEQARRAAEAPEAQADKLYQAFNAAKAAGLLNPKIRIDGFEFKPAKESSRWPGSVYALQDGAYIGRVTEGRFFASRACTEEASRRVLEIMADPAKAAEAHGLQTGKCSCCGRTLTNKDSVGLGIGPICRSRFGW